MSDFGHDDLLQYDRTEDEAQGREKQSRPRNLVPQQAGDEDRAGEHRHDGRQPREDLCDRAEWPADQRNQPGLQDRTLDEAEAVQRRIVPAPAADSDLGEGDGQAFLVVIAAQDQQGKGRKNHESGKQDRITRSDLRKPNQQMLDPDSVRQPPVGSGKIHHLA